MSKEFEKLMCAHEESDKYYIESIKEIKARVKEEFENADEFLEYLESDEKTAQAFFDYSGTKPYSFRIIPVRKSNELYVKKHTSTQRPYYHSHAFYELIFVQSGKGAYFSYPQGEKIAISKGDVCLCAPGSINALARAAKKDVVIKFVIPAELSKACFPLSDLIENGEIKIFSDVGDKAASFLVNALKESGKSSKYCTEQQKAWLTLFFASITQEKEAVKGDVVQKFEKYVQSSLRTADLSGFAKFAGYNTDYAARLFKQATGKTFCAALTDLRLKRAKKLLKESDITVEGVALAVGFANASGLYKQFSASFGITPAKYRRSAK